MTARTFTLILLAAASLTPARAADSAYSDLDLGKCREIEATDSGASWACKGYAGLPLTVSEGDLRFFLSYGRDGGEDMVATQTLPPFNHLGPRIEWRLDGSGAPFASIVRYFTDREDPEPDAQVLVVTKLEPGNSCHIAYVEATANGDANALAREAADELAEDFDCAADEVEVLGAFTAWDY